MALVCGFVTKSDSRVLTPVDVFGKLTAQMKNHFGCSQDSFAFSEHAGLLQSSRGFPKRSKNRSERENR